MTYAEHADPVSFAVCAGVRISASCILELTQSLVVVLRASSVHTRETHVMIGNVYNKITQCTSFPLMDGCEDYQGQGGGLPPRPKAQTQSPDPSVSKHSGPPHPSPSVHVLRARCTRYSSKAQTASPRLQSPQCIPEAKAAGPGYRRAPSVRPPLGAASNGQQDAGR